MLIKSTFGVNKPYPANKNHPVGGGFFMARRLGLEPRYTAPEAVVLPLDDLRMWPDDTENTNDRQSDTDE